MLAGKVTEHAKKKFEEGNTNVDAYLAQVKEQLALGLTQGSMGNKNAPAQSGSKHANQKEADLKN